MERLPVPGGRLRVAVNTQTPLIRFAEGALQAAARLEDLEEGSDFKMTTGGVTRMLLPLLRRWRREGVVADAEWVAMGSDAHPGHLRHGDVTLSFVGMPPDEKAGYALAKERMWALLNSNPSTPDPHGAEGVPDEAWAAFDAYQRRSARALEEATGRLGGLDLLYVHDFQQVAVARAWSGPDVPKLFHLHTPFPSVLPAGWARWFVGHLRRYDAVVVSTDRYAANLRAAGLDVPIHVVHPFIDPEEFTPATPARVRELRERFGVAESDRVVLNVGRMDPMKGQDRLLRAMPRLLRRVPDARLVLVGNGSFSSSRKGGLGLDKGQRWRARLERLADQLRVAERVTFTGHLGDDLLAAAYDVCDVFALPSTREGFGLAAIEAWRHEKPVVVSDRAGVSELVEEGVDGRVVDCARAGALADVLADLLASPARADMGAMGRRKSDAATLPVGATSLERVVDSILEGAKVRATL